MEIGGQKPTISLNVKSEGPQTAVFDYTLNAEKNSRFIRSSPRSAYRPAAKAKLC